MTEFTYTEEMNFCEEKESNKLEKFFTENDLYCQEWCELEW